MKPIFLILITLCLQARSATFTIKDLGTRNLFAMYLDGALEKNIAVTRFLSGVILYDNEKSELSGNWEVDLRTLDTQNEMRNLELREHVLKTPEYPVLRVQLPAVNVKGLMDEKVHNVPANLIYQYAGKNIPLKAQLKLNYFKQSPKSQQRLPGNLLRVIVNQDWNLDNFGLSVAENFKMIFPTQFATQADFVGSDSLPTDKPIFPDAPKPK